MFDHARRLWGIYLRMLSDENLEKAVDLFNRLDLNESQKIEVMQAFWSNARHRTALFVEPLKGSKGRLQSAWAEVFMRSLPKAEQENFKKIVERYRFGERVSDRLFWDFYHRALSRRKSFKERLAWLEENVPTEEWRSRFISSPGIPPTINVQSKLIRGMADFPSEFEAMPEGEEKDLFRLLKAEELRSRLGFHGKGSKEDLLGVLEEMRVEEDRQIVIQAWLRAVRYQKPDEEPELRKALREAGLGVEGGRQ
jgi:hypothetical protein